MEQNINQLIADAEAAAKAGEIEQAEKKYLSALEIDPDSASALYGLGTIAMQCNQPEHALKCLRRAQTLEPEAVDIAYNLAHCYQQLGDPGQAVLQLQHATKFCKADPVFCPLIADFLLRLGEPSAAIQLLARLQVLPPSEQIILARAQAAKSNWREAVNILKRLNSVLPKDAKIANDLAVAAGKLRDYDTSIASFERYLTLVTPSAQDYLRFADLLLIAQRADRCDKALKLAIEHGEDGSEVFVMQAKVARLNGDYSAANRALVAALERTPNDGQAWTMRAELAEDKQFKSLIELLKAELGQEVELDLQHRALLNYALADMQDRSEGYKDAADSLLAANEAQYQSLQDANNTYQPKHTEQMVDRLIENFNRDMFDSADVQIQASSTSVQPIFIVGMPRSGTTLVERIIGQNSQVFNAGEQEAMEFVVADFNQKTLDGKLPELHLISPHQWSELRALYLQKLPEISKPIFTDKLPHNFRHVGIIHKLFPEARIVQLHRDSQDVCMSIYSRAFTAGHNYANRWPDLKHFYTECERLMAHWSSMNSPRIMDLKYEDLVENPEYYAKQLVEFCGFKWNESYLDFHQSTNKSFTFSEMQVRQPIANKRVGRWQKYADHLPELSEL
ncbi:MAG: tetratricopeptide (TPR) repeat protein [Paracoccaceae bacterium]